MRATPAPLTEMRIGGNRSGNAVLMIGKPSGEPVSLIFGLYTATRSVVACFARMTSG